ncbi:hypothetical protein [Streptomyces sp. NBC_01451]|uniref:hypothetical protein n=1 Tax=Streptomyces sp. NBC_01451 TaxID=2903872 RepID=UPI002E3401E4|nr:hypothetical protein [Streptomyces sp. NBC_01451]
MTTHTDTPTVPRYGWLADLDDQQLQGLVGAMVTVISGARAATGLLTDIEGGTARIFNERHSRPIEFRVSSTNYERVPGSPMRLALAHALVYQRAWDEQYETLTDGNGNALNMYDYDKARGEWEQGLPEVYEALMAENRRLLFGVTDGPESNG